ncbi:MAG: hypothetical protein NE330_10000 [Lentisphaeraceae bacterium]|nr:hypothetical protein [Lentisphaeraceae bacterium]
MKGYLIISIFLTYFFSLSAATPEAYSIETISTPPEVRFHVTGLDIDKSGSVYCATRFGDVWKLKNNKWTHFAQGLHEPCGLLVDDDGSVVVTQKPEMTRLVDSNKDGIADRYINLSSEFEFHNNYHEFNFGGIKDDEGNYIGTLNLGHEDPQAFGLSLMVTRGGYRGWAYKVSPSGEFTPFASGLRSPAGLGKNSKGEIFYTDNQGDFVSTSMLHQLQEDKFYGHPASLLDQDFTAEKLRSMKDEDFNKMRTRPVVWIPHNEIAQSPGNPEWDATKGKFGPFSDQFFIGDQSRSSIFRVSLQKVGDAYQGCVFDFMTGFQSGAMRLKFDNKGALWVGETGRGWLARGAKMYGLQKVTWNGTVPFEVLDVKLTETGFKVTFTKELDEKTINSLTLKSWKYNYSKNYGCPKKDIQGIRVNNLSLSADKKTLHFDAALTEERVFAFDFSQIHNAGGETLVNSQAFYTLIKKLNK